MYSPPAACAACNATELQFNKLKIPFTKVIADAAMVEEFKNQGLSSFPVVVVEMGDSASWTWSGYRHTDIARLKALFKESSAA